MYYPLEINFNLFYSLTRRGRSACEGAFHAISPTYRSPEQQRGGGWWHQLAPRTRRQAENSFKQTERTTIKGSRSCLSFDSRLIQSSGESRPKWEQIHSFSDVFPRGLFSSRSSLVVRAVCRVGETSCSVRSLVCFLFHLECVRD